MRKSEQFNLDNIKTLKDERRKNWFWDSNDIFSSDLSAYAKLVRLYLARCANGDRQAFPSYNRIAKDCGISRDTAKRAVAELEEKGWVVKRLQKREDGEHLSNVYHLCDPPETVKKEIAKSVNDSEGGRCSQHPPCHNLEGVGADSTHVGAVCTQVGADTAYNNTNITIPSEQDTCNPVIHSTIHHDNDHNRARVKTEKCAVDNVDNVDEIDKYAEMRKILKDAGFDITQIEVEYISQWASVFSFEMIRYAVKKSVLNGKKSLPYIGGIFESWLDKGIRTVEQAERETRFDSFIKSNPPFV